MKPLDKSMGNKRNRWKILAKEMEYYKIYCNLTRIGKITNEEIAGRMKVEKKTENTMKTMEDRTR